MFNKLSFNIMENFDTEQQVSFVDLSNQIKIENSKTLQRFNDSSLTENVQEVNLDKKIPSNVQAELNRFNLQVRVLNRNANIYPNQESEDFIKARDESLIFFQDAMKEQIEGSKIRSSVFKEKIDSFKENYRFEENTRENRVRIQELKLKILGKQAELSKANEQLSREDRKKNLIKKITVFELQLEQLENLNQSVNLLQSKIRPEEVNSFNVVVQSQVSALDSFLQKREEIISLSGELGINVRIPEYEMEIPSIESSPTISKVKALFAKATVDLKKEGSDNSNLIRDKILSIKKDKNLSPNKSLEDIAGRKAVLDEEISELLFEEECLLKITGGLEQYENKLKALEDIAEEYKKTEEKIEKTINDFVVQCSDEVKIQEELLGILIENYNRQTSNNEENDLTDNFVFLRDIGEFGNLMGESKDYIKSISTMTDIEKIQEKVEDLKSFHKTLLEQIRESRMRVDYDKVTNKAILVLANKDISFHQAAFEEKKNSLKSVVDESIREFEKTTKALLGSEERIVNSKLEITQYQRDKKKDMSSKFSDTAVRFEKAKNIENPLARLKEIHEIKLQLTERRTERAKENWKNLFKKAKVILIVVKTLESIKSRLNPNKNIKMNYSVKSQKSPDIKK